MLKIAICDDDQVFAEELNRKVHRLIGKEEYGVCSYTSVEKMDQAMAAGELPDIVFMDIELGDGDGIALVKRLFTGTGTHVIYMTSYMEYCTAVYETEHIYFLTKPIADADLRRALQKAHDSLLGRDKKLLFESKSGTACFTASDVLYIESSYRKLTVHTSDSESTFYGSITDAMRKTNGRFVQCHKSFLVNLRRIKAMEGDAFLMDNGARVPISRGMRENTRDIFFKYLGEQ